MAIGKTPDFSRNVAQRVIKEHGLEGKVTPEALAEQALRFDDKSPGYISKDEFALAAADLKAALGGDSDAAQVQSGAPTHNAIGIRGAVISTTADMSDKRLQNAKARILVNVGEGARFGPLDAGEGLRAFSLDDKVLSGIADPELGNKLGQVNGGGAAFAVLTTGDSPALTIASATTDLVQVVAKYDLMDPANAKILGGDGDPLKAAAALFGGAPAIELGGEDKSFNLASSDWSSGAAFPAKQKIRQDKNSARDAARAARAAARDAALNGPSTLAEFAGVTQRPHTDVEKKALLDLVTKGAGEDAVFPDPDQSYYGLHTFLLEGPEAAHAVAFAVANGGGAADFDPDKHSVILTAKSFDEAQIGTFVVDRKTQDVVFADESNTVDYDTKAVGKFFPKADLDDAFDAHVIGTLTGRGELLGVVAGDDTPDDMDFTGW